MKQRIGIKLSRKPQPECVISCKQIKIRERIMRALLGEQKQILIMIPGNNVSEIMISKASNAEEYAEPESQPIATL